MQRIELPRQTRAASFTPESYDGASNTIDVVFATEAPIRRYDPTIGYYVESLVLQPGAADLDRLNAGAPFLDTHRDQRIEMSKAASFAALRALSAARASRQ